MRIRGGLEVNERRGFALPTVLIASTVMLLILATTLVSVSSGVAVALDTRHYNTYAKTAAVSGLAMAQACLKGNNYVPQWSDASPLQPNTNCSGVTQGSVSAYIHNSDGVQSTFSVPGPTTLANGVQRITVSAQSNRIRTSTGQVWRSYSENTFATISGQTSFNSIAFGYVSGGDNTGGGAFFGVVNPNGTVSTVGFNAHGQLGNGTSTNTATPSSYTLPSGKTATQLYANFLSIGYTLFAVTSDGLLYGAGSNFQGQLGRGVTGTFETTPVQFQLPAGVTARYVAPGYTFTFVVGSNNNIYSSGGCDAGILGYTYTVSGCANQSSYKRVALPTPNVSDLNTLPVATSDWVQSTNLATDRFSAFIRMQGGRVYGWGENDNGQLGSSVAATSSTPVKIGTWGDAGQPQAKQLAFDGETLYVLDSNGTAWAQGANVQGSLAGARAPIKSNDNQWCMDSIGATMNDGERIGAWSCINYSPQLLEWTPLTSELKFSAAGNKCVDNQGNASGNGNPIQTYTCNGSDAQKWVYRDNGSIYNPATGKCLDLPNSNQGTYLQLWECNGSGPQTFRLGNAPSPQPVPIPNGEKVTRITTDQYTVLFLTDAGNVWGAGRNELGQLGIGSTGATNTSLKQFQLPSGKKAVNFYTTADGLSSASFYSANSYVVLDDGSVYGVGSNTKGQLGYGATSPYEATPRKMNLPTGVQAQTVQSGYGTTVVLTSNGRIYTVGNNASGQLGDGTTTNSSTPLARQYINVSPLILY